MGLQGADIVNCSHTKTGSDASERGECYKWGDNISTLPHPPTVSKVLPGFLPQCSTAPPYPQLAVQNQLPRAGPSRAVPDHSDQVLHHRSGPDGPPQLPPPQSTSNNERRPNSENSALLHRQHQGTHQVAAPAGQVMFQPLDTEPVAQPMDSGRLSQFWGTPVMPQPSTPSLDSVRRSKCQQSHKHGVSYPISHINRPLPPDKVNTSLQVISAINNIGLDLEKMAQDQPLDPDFQRLSTDSLSGLQFRKLNMGDKDLYVDVSNGPARPFVPFTWKRRVIQALSRQEKSLHQNSCGHQ